MRTSHPPLIGPSLEIAATQKGGDLPSRIELMPAGRVEFGDGRDPVELRDAAAVMARSMAEAAGGMLPIDFDHGSETEGGSTRAAGWITGLDVKGNRVLADVTWTPEGAAALRDRVYRFISPVYLATKDAREVVRILRAGLTNTPALPQLSAVASTQKERDGMDPLKEIAKALGLPEDTEAASIVAGAKLARERLEAMGGHVKEAAAALNLGEGATIKDVADAARAAAAPDPAKWAPRQALDDLAKEVASLKADKASGDAAQAVEAAKAAGKLAPSLQSWAVDYACRDLAGFKAWADAAPVVVPEGSVVPAKGASGGAVLDAVEKEVCRQLGVDTTQFLATRQGSEGGA